LILEIKAVVTIIPAHEAQLRTYLRMSGIRVGLLLNFNAHAWWTASPGHYVDLGSGKASVSPVPSALPPC